MNKHFLLTLRREKGRKLKTHQRCLKAWIEFGPVRKNRRRTWDMRNDEEGEDGGLGRRSRSLQTLWTSEAHACRRLRAAGKPGRERPGRS